MDEGSGIVVSLGGDRNKRQSYPIRKSSSFNTLKLNDASLHSEATTEASSQSMATMKRRSTGTVGTDGCTISLIVSDCPLQRFDIVFASKIFQLEEKQQLIRRDCFCESRFYQDLVSATSNCGKTSCSPGEGRCRATKMVHFHDVMIREYPIIIGDNPSVSGGTPLTIDWKFVSETSIDFDVYEETRERAGGRRNMETMVLTKFHREVILKRLGFSQYDRNVAAKEATIVRNKRRHSNTTEMIKYQKTYESVENIVRKLKNVLSLGRIQRAEKEYLRKYVPSLQKTE